jgi:hypothetical protein
MQSRPSFLRNSKGASTAILVLITAVFVLLPLGLLGFEISRIMLVQAQLRNITDSAALSGTAAMASAPLSIAGVPYTVAQREGTAMYVAWNTFQQNSILSAPLNTGNVVAYPAQPTYQTDPGPTPTVPAGGYRPPVHSAVISMTLKDKNGNTVNPGVDAATLSIQSWFTEFPVFTSTILPIGQATTVTALSNGGLPALDLILCFDVSGSMDDQTNVYFVNRYWDTIAGKMRYDVLNPGGTADTIFNLCQPPDYGTGLNAYPPEQLSFASYGPSASSNGTPYIWSEAPSNVYAGPTYYPNPYPPGTTQGLRSNFNFTPIGGFPESGLPPGNVGAMPAGTGAGFAGHQDGASWTRGQTPPVFTDMVMAIPGSAGGFNFPDVPTLVEASRGNLDSAAALKQACNNTSALTPQAGYYNAYWNYVVNNELPISAARTAATNFFQTMSVSSNCHFGLVPFSDVQASSPTGKWPEPGGHQYSVDSGYAGGGTGIFPLPLVALNLTNDNYNTSLAGTPTVTQVMSGSGSTPPLVPLGGTDIADALKEGIAELSSGNARPSATKAIILFTDGIPDNPVDIATGTAQAIHQAKLANPLGIPIYTLGLSTNASILTKMRQVLGDNVTVPYQGIAYWSGNKASYIEVTTSSDINQAFQDIARKLCVLQ